MLFWTITGVAFCGWLIWEFTHPAYECGECGSISDNRRHNFEKNLCPNCLSRLK